VQRKIIEGVLGEAGYRSIDEQAAGRDRMLLGLLPLREKA
jgi:hypothetical protein